MENKTFEANFSATGTPTIKIYEVKGGVYTLVKSDTMVATPETGKYSYNFKELNQLSDYSARMELGAETSNGVYNGIFSTILARTVERGGGGGGSYKMTPEELERIVEEMTKLMKESLSDIEVSLPDGIGETEIAKAIGRLEAMGKKNLKEITDATENQKRIIEQFDLRATERGQGGEEIIKRIDSLIENQKDLTGVLKDEIIKQIEEGIEKSIKSGSDVSKNFAKLLTAFREERKTETQNFAKLLTAFRNEIKK
jgi:hypothetical protein